MKQRERLDSSSAHTVSPSTLWVFQVERIALAMKIVADILSTSASPQKTSIASGTLSSSANGDWKEEETHVAVPSHAIRRSNSEVMLSVSSLCESGTCVKIVCVCVCVCVLVFTCVCASVLLNAFSVFHVCVCTCVLFLSRNDPCVFRAICPC